jgi:hypothetical protein
VVGEYTPVPSARHSPYPAHLNPASNDTLIGDYVAYSNNLFNIDGITDPGPGNREYIGLSTGVCTVIQQPSSEDSNAVYQCYTSLQFQSGKYAPSSIFLASEFQSFASFALLSAHDLSFCTMSGNVVADSVALE